ncbi:type II secretion system protein GspJ [Sphingomonas spermidinifaciens]|uniref:type II secretion system protein GspJ n=1 Tax=Sphingomonas spermidinifaciens TaxID=1141889 RepID=UPI001FE336E4|nr:type II secretion system protein GspJ [Sphingomonas spermidinifaciens]
MTAANTNRVTAQEAGFTLIELMISLALFALIAVAGLALVDSILGVEGRTAARLDAQGAMSRAMYVLTNDVDQIARGRIVSNGHELIFTRAAPGLGGPPVEIRWIRSGDTLVRLVGGAQQVVLPGVSRLDARFLDDGGWRAAWPPSEERAEDWPRAVEMTIGLGTRGTLRRVVALPARPASGP